MRIIKLKPQKIFLICPSSLLVVQIAARIIRKINITTMNDLQFLILPNRPVFYAGL